MSGDTDGPPSSGSAPDGKASLTSIEHLDDKWGVTCEGTLGPMGACSTPAAWVFLGKVTCCERSAAAPGYWLACSWHYEWLESLSVGHCVYCGRAFNPAITAYSSVEPLNRR